MSVVRHLFLAQLERFIDRHLYRFQGPIPFESDSKNLRSSDLRRWPKVPRPWLTGKECLLIGMAHAYTDLEKAFLYLNEAVVYPGDQDLKQVAKLAEAIVLFKEAIARGEEKKSWLRLARLHFLEFNHSNKNLVELALLYATLTYVAEDQMPLAIQTMTRAAKVQHNPQIYHMISNFYQCQKMFKVADFFKRRSIRYAHRQEMVA